ncbi:biopolymer transporter ExbD [Caballeronia mineralivorans PML1(12)]|jgi:biopolymer transport protein TolR|uniref:Biopolymer transporter ExbD n=1 Tax=Caballeronia mineralivorans PML1(12) TaxID=908627 RepID=A0A0J1FZ87_9BURK|nr:protein TolR [Caballeronia mineralivorans]KLU25263.1 biopolymer transporter ExbD [Caballeronia mineralivorans PML1(12)]
MAVKLSNNRGAVGGVPPVSEINVTPLVDVMLVLLIVFMVAAPLMASGVKVDLPTSNAKPLSEEKPPIAVSLNAAGKLYVDKTEVTNATLVGALTSATEGDKTRRINIRGDKGLAYGKVIEAMGEINDAGFSKIALVSEPPQTP